MLFFSFVENFSVFSSTFVVNEATSSGVEPDGSLVAGKSNQENSCMDDLFEWLKAPQTKCKDICHLVNSSDLVRIWLESVGWEKFLNLIKNK